MWSNVPDRRYQGAVLDPSVYTLVQTVTENIFQMAIDLPYMGDYLSSDTVYTEQNTDSLEQLSNTSFSESTTFFKASRTEFEKTIAQYEKQLLGLDPESEYFAALKEAIEEAKSSYETRC